MNRRLENILLDLHVPVLTLKTWWLSCLQMTELQLEILFGGMGYDVQNVRIVEDLRTGANKG